jgi:hypothetical protein
MLALLLPPCDYDRRGACVDAVLDELRHRLQRIALGQRDDRDRIPVVADTQVPRVRALLIRCGALTWGMGSSVPGFRRLSQRRGTCHGVVIQNAVLEIPLEQARKRRDQRGLPFAAGKQRQAETDLEQGHAGDRLRRRRSSQATTTASGALRINAESVRTENDHLPRSAHRGAWPWNSSKSSVNPVFPSAPRCAIQGLVARASLPSVRCAECREPLFHAAPMALGATFQPLLDGFLEITNDELRHGLRAWGHEIS